MIEYSLENDISPDHGNMLASWPKVRLGRIASLLSGFAFKSEKFNSDGRGMPIVRIRDVVRGSSETFYEGEYDPKYVVQDGDYLIGMDGEFNLARWKGGPALLNQRVCKLNSVNDDIDRDYLAKFLPNALKAIETSTSFVTVKHLSIKDLLSIELPCPPLREQQRISAIMDKAEELRAKRRAAIALLDQLPQAIFLEMFGDPVTNSKGWDISSLEDLAKQKPNNGIFRKNAEYLSSGHEGLPVIWVEELFRLNPIDTAYSRRVIPTKGEIEKYGLKHGDLLFCRSSLKLDGIAFNNIYLGQSEDALFECHIIRISLDVQKVDPSFVNLMLRLPSMRERVKGRAKTATMTTIDQAGLGSTVVIVPPFDLQRQFALRVEAIYRAKVTQQRAFAEVDALFASLQNQMFKPVGDDEKERYV